MYFTFHAGFRLAGAIVRVGLNSDRNNSVCDTITLAQVNANQKVELTCDLEGQYLSIELPIDERLQLCEVQAFEGNCAGRIVRGLKIILIVKICPEFVFVKTRAVLKRPN